MSTTYALINQPLNSFLAYEASRIRFAVVFAIHDRKASDHLSDDAICAHLFAVFDFFVTIVLLDLVVLITHIKSLQLLTFPEYSAF